MGKGKGKEHVGQGEAATKAREKASDKARDKAREKARVPTAFEMRVYELLRKRVPRGRVTSYAALAKALGSSARAVGGAMRRNPFAPHVPCHRCVCADGSLGGFNGRMRNPKKERMLRAEGVRFEKSGTVEAGCFVTLDADEVDGT